MTFKSDSWVVLSTIEQGIKQKIESIGKPLKEWDVNIYRGILTGYNEAFIINKETRDKLITASPKNDEIIRPILRGKHIKKYGKLNQTEWLILIPSGWTNKNRGEKDPELFFKEIYPSIYDHFIAKSKLKSKGKGLFLRDDKGNYWWELRPCDYLPEFEKEKILYIDIMTDNEKEGYHFPAFSFAKNGVFTLNTGYFIVGNNEDLKYILGVLNSKIGRFIVKSNVTPLQKRQYRIFQHFMEKFYIPLPNDETKNKVIAIVDKIVLKKSADSISKIEENLLDDLLIQLCGITAEESSFIDSM